MQDADATYRSAILPPEQPTSSASWTEDQSGPSTFDAGTNGQAAYGCIHSGQNVAQLAQPVIPPVAALRPPAGYLSAPRPVINARPFLFYPPEYAAASQSDTSVPESSHPQYIGMPSWALAATNPPFYEQWQGQ